MVITKELLTSKGFEEEDLGYFRLFLLDGSYICVHTNDTPIVEVVSGKEMARVETFSAERVNTILSIFHIKFRL